MKVLLLLFLALSGGFIFFSGEKTLDYKSNKALDNSLLVFSDSVFAKKYPLVLESLNSKLSASSLKSSVNYKVNLTQTSLSNSKGNQYFEIEISGSQIEIKSETEHGLLNGIVRLENEAGKTSGKLMDQQISDYSNIDHRAFHFGLRGNEDMNVVKDLIKTARTNYFNEAIILVFSGVQLNSLKADLAKQWSKKDLEELVKYCKQFGLKVVPEVKLLTHQEKLFADSYPNLMANKSTYNPDNESVYNIIFPIIDEILGIFQCDTLCIGHDEVAGYRSDRNEKYIKKGEKGINPQQYLNDIKKLHEYLSEKGIKTMMWADMLLDPKDFPSMSERNMHGGNGFSKIINDLPKDIILGDWHYFNDGKDFPTYDYLRNKGFSVYGAVWYDNVARSNFINYINNSHFDNKAVIATTWYNLNSKSKETMELLTESGNIIWSMK